MKVSYITLIQIDHVDIKIQRLDNGKICISVEDDYDDEISFELTNEELHEFIGELSVFDEIE